MNEKAVSDHDDARAHLRLGFGNPTPADLYLDDRPLSQHLRWPETLACMDRAIARLFAFFQQADQTRARTHS